MLNQINEYIKSILNYNISSTDIFDNKNIIIYSSITLFIFYILEQIEFRKISLFVLIFVSVFSYYNSNTIKDKFIDYSNTSNVLNNKNNINKLEELDEKIKDNNLVNKIKKIKVLDKNFINNVPKFDTLEHNINQIKKFIKINTKKLITNLGMSNFNTKNLDIYNILLKFMNIYLNQIEIILNVESYKHKSFEKLLNTKENIFNLIHSLHFKVDMNKDIEISKLIKNMNSVFSQIELYLKTYINDDWLENPNYLKGVVNIYDEPSAFDELSDKKCHLMKIKF